MIWTAIFSTAFLVQAGYWLLFCKGFRRVLRPPAPRQDHPISPISVVVAARDEADNLPALLDALTRQTHPDFEVVIADDGSMDDTADIVRRWGARHPNIRLVQVQHPQAPRKKNALTQGIAATRHPLLAFTDADCIPPPEWLRLLAARHSDTDGPLLLVGYGPFHQRPGLLNAFSRYEKLLTAFSAAAAIGLKVPYTAGGCNLSYPRALFDAVGGYAHSQRAMSGDDDLFLQEVTRRNAATVQYMADPRTFVPTEAKRTWRSWLHMKRRHTSAGVFYRPVLQLHLQLFHATGIGLWLAPLLAGWAGAGLLVAKLLLQAGVLRRATQVFEARAFLPLLPFWDFLYAAYNLLLAPLGVLFPPKTWGREEGTPFGPARMEDGG